MIFSDSDSLRPLLFAVLTLVGIAIIVWSLVSLNPRRRGKTLVTAGPFRYFRHPLYAAFLGFFNFGLAVWLNNWIHVLWALLLHPVWHFLVKEEERMLMDIFPRDSEEYCRKTRRFFPRLISKKR